MTGGEVHALGRSRLARRLVLASDPVTGAMLGMGAADGGTTGHGSMAMDPKAAQLNAQQQMQSGSKEPPLAQNS